EPERLGEHAPAAHHALLLGEQDRARTLIVRHAVVRRHVAPGDVFVERALDDRAHVSERRESVAEVRHARALPGSASIRSSAILAAVFTRSFTTISFSTR